MKQSR